MTVDFIKFSKEVRTNFTFQRFETKQNPNQFTTSYNEPQTLLNHFRKTIF